MHVFMCMCITQQRCVCCVQALDMDITLLDKKIDQMMPELGFK